eukprot:5145904-Pyramimonas_sp.AAC.1
MLVSLTWGSSLVAMPYAVGALGYIGALLAVCVLHACSTYASLLVMEVRYLIYIRCIRPLNQGLYTTSTRLADTSGGKEIRVLYDVLYDYTTYSTYYIRRVI